MGSTLLKRIGLELRCLSALDREVVLALALALRRNLLENGLLVNLTIKALLQYLVLLADCLVFEFVLVSLGVYLCWTINFRQVISLL